jgi:hypothetical protein
MARGNQGKPKQIAGHASDSARIAGLPKNAIVKSGKAVLPGQPIPSETKAQNPRNWTNPRPIPGGAPPAMKVTKKPGSSGGY